MKEATCRNVECSQHALAVPVDVALDDAEDVFCGQCQKPCDLTDTP